MQDLIEMILTYKGYCTKVHYSVNDGVYYGEIEYIRDLVNFESENIENVEKEFHQAVDDYIQFCNDRGEEPEKPTKKDKPTQFDRREWTTYKTLQLLSVYKHESGMDIFVNCDASDPHDYSMNRPIGIRLVYKKRAKEITFPYWRFETLLGAIYILNEIDRLGDHLLLEVHGVINMGMSLEEFKEQREKKWI